MGRENRAAAPEPRRGTEPADEAFLRLVGERVRLQRLKNGMSRKALSQDSGVSERYLAELERGTGNASLLVLRGIAAALNVRVDDLASERSEGSIDVRMAIRQLERLSPEDMEEARELLAERFGYPVNPAIGRIALIGLRGAGKASLGRAAARALGVPSVELDNEIAKASGMDVAEIFAMHGETVYRRLERESLAAVVGTMPRAILTTGGGLVLSPETYDLLLRKCFVIWVKASKDQLVERASSAIGLNGSGLSPKAQQEFERVMVSRKPLYERAHAIIETTGKNQEDVLAEFLAMVGKRFAAQNDLS